MADPKHNPNQKTEAKQLNRRHFSVSGLGFRGALPSADKLAFAQKSFIGAALGREAGCL